MLPPFDASVDNPKVQRGNTAVFRCNVPEAVRDHVVITSWIQDNRYDIFLSSSQGRGLVPPSQHSSHPFIFLNFNFPAKKFQI